VPVPRAFKTDESFLEKIAIGATGTRRVFQDLDQQGHDPMELERGSMSFKIWKAIKIKRVRVPDILCLLCGHRVESRGKTKLEITMSHSLSAQERGWDSGLDDSDRVALVHCQRVGPGPLDWSASALVQYIRVEPMRETFRAGLVKQERPKGASEGFEVRITWPAALASAVGVVEEVTDRTIRFRKMADQRIVSVRRQRSAVTLRPLVKAGDPVQPTQIVASVVPVTAEWPCPGGSDAPHYVELSHSASLSDRYTAVKALGRFDRPEATQALLERMGDAKEHIYVRVDAAAGLMRRSHPTGADFLATTLHDTYLENRLESAIVLGEVATSKAASLLIATLQDPEQDPEIRAGAAWALGEIGTKDALPALVQSFNALDMIVRIEAARALAKLARRHLDDVLQIFPESSTQERPGIAWALSKAGGFTFAQVLPTAVDEDSRQWLAYIIGTQDREAILPAIEALASRDPQVYFAVTVLWKIIASWVYDLEEY
jgi:HEAT repeat protein